MGELVMAESTAAMIKDNKITAGDVRNLRRTMFQDEVVSKVEAETLFALDEAVAEKCHEWHEFFVEALVDFTVNQMEPRGYVNDENAHWLMRCISRDNAVETATELELLVRILEKAKSSTGFLVKCALEQVSLAVIEGRGVVRGGESLQPGVIGKAEVDLLRRILYAFGGDGNVAITRTEAEILFDLNDKTIEAENHPSWSDLFVKAVTNFLMAASGYTVPNRGVAMREEEWLAAGHQADVSGFFSKMFSGGMKGIMQAYSGAGVEDTWRERNEEMDKRIASAEEITADEAEWLAGRIGRDGVVHQNEQALLDFIKEESPKIHPALKELLDSAA